jgi:mono/diheme cytochrome c family protein
LRINIFQGGNEVKAFTVLLIVAVFLGLSCVSDAQDPGMMGPGKGKRSQAYAGTAGEKTFNLQCSRCHPNGGNVILPDLPLRGSSKLADFNTFLSFIRDPKMPDGSEGVMPVFSKKQLSDQEAKTLYNYITLAGASGTMGRGHGMMGGSHGMMGGGHGMMGGGHGMMGGGYGMMGGGYGMMGGYYQSEECQKILDETAELRKELYNKRFEYSEAYRNPKTTAETIVQLEREIYDLQKKIYAKAPLGCGW